MIVATWKQKKEEAMNNHAKLIWRTCYIIYNYYIIKQWLTYIYREKHAVSARCVIEHVIVVISKNLSVNKVHTYFLKYQTH